MHACEAGILVESLASNMDDLYLSQPCKYHITHAVIRLAVILHQANFICQLRAGISRS